MSIALVAPARFAGDEVVRLANQACAARGTALNSPHWTPYHQFSGTDEERANAFVSAWNDGDSDVLWCVRGGYGSGRILPLIRNRIEPRRKILIGYSDQTYLLAFLNKYRLGAAVHGPMPIDLLHEEKHAAVDTLLNRASRRDFAAVWNGSDGALRSGSGRGKLIVGNLHVLTRLIGTPEEPDWTGAILLVEDVDEYFYSIDRMFLHLSQAGVLDRINGLALGSFTGTQDNDIPFGLTVPQIALHHLGKRDIPVACGAPVGHGAENMPLVYGADCSLTCDAATGAVSLKVGGL